MFKLTKKIKSVIERDSGVMLHTTREIYPFVSDHGSGDFVYDISGNKFIDFTSFISVYNFGVDENEQIRSAIKKQIDKLMHAAFTDYYSELPVTFAEKFIGMFPNGFGRLFYSNSGTEAVEDAIKLSKLFTKRQYLISFYGAFHGRTMGSLGLTASKTVHRAHYGPFNSVIHVPFPYPYRCPFGTNDPEECSKACIEYIQRNVLGKEVPPNEVAAIFIEPVQGEGGYIVPPKSFVKELRKLTEDNGILLVADEIQAGYMRTGKFLALGNFGVVADIYTMAKAVGGGLPIGVTVAKSSFGNVPAGSHSNTFGGNLVSIAAANATLDYVKRNMRSLQSGIARKSGYLFKRLNRMKDDYEIIGDVRGIGLMIGVEFVKSKTTKEPAEKERDKILEQCFYNNLLMMPCGSSTVRIIPPLTIDDKVLEKGMDIFEDAVRDVNKTASK